MALFSAPILAAPAFAIDAPQVTTDRFSSNITILGPAGYENPFGGTYRLWRIRSWVDKQTHIATSQLYVELHYFWAWRFYDSAATDHAEQLQVTPIDRQVEDCSAMCSYHEVIGIALDEAMLRARASTGMQIKISAHSGDSIIVTVSPEQIAAQVSALDQNGAIAGSSESRGAVASATPVGARFGVRGVLLNATTIAALHVASDHGFFVVAADEGSPATKAGIAKADVILTFNGVEVRSVDSLQAAIGAVKTGSTVPIHLLRVGQELDVNAQF